MQKILFAGHWLAFLWAVTTRGALTKAVKHARSAKATAFELIYHVLNKLEPKETAEALKAGGITTASMCIFFPDGDQGSDPPMGDPLGEGKVREQALKTFRRVLGFIRRLQSHGITINTIVGPSCFVLGKKYQGLDWDEKKRRITAFYSDLADDLQAANVQVAIEMLRVGEDYVFENVDQWEELINTLNAELGDGFGAHYDTFHMRERGFDLVAVIRQLGLKILHLHLNGDGRRPAGGEGDTLVWKPIVDALREQGIDEVFATNEPFCQTVRDNCPPLGNGLPPAVEEPGGMIKTRETLVAAGVQFAA